VGKILNRFTKDLQCLDNVLCFNVGSLFAYFYQSIASLIVAGYTVPYVLIATAFFVFLGALLFRFALQAYKECNRVESVTKSPMLSFL
jgi:hypothetical protein